MLREQICVFGTFIYWGQIFFILYMRLTRYIALHYTFIILLSLLITFFTSYITHYTVFIKLCDKFVYFYLSKFI